jgi:hypothetical protein
MGDPSQDFCPCRRAKQRMPGWFRSYSWRQFSSSTPARGEQTVVWEDPAIGSEPLGSGTTRQASKEFVLIAERDRHACSPHPLLWITPASRGGSELPPAPPGAGRLRLPCTQLKHAFQDATRQRDCTHVAYPLCTDRHRQRDLHARCCANP